MRRAVLITRQAISPRLAIRIFLNIKPQRPLWRFYRLAGAPATQSISNPFSPSKEPAMRFANKVALVTGGNSGIGRAIVRRFAHEGARVAFVGRDPEKGRKVEAEERASGGHVAFFACDLAREAAAAKLLSDLAEWGRLDI